MKIERAIEILDPASLPDHTPEEWVTAHRMACQALALLRWKPVETEGHPADDEPVLGVATADFEGEAWLDNDICVVEYDEVLDEWTLTDDLDATPVQVSHWHPLPELPDELRFGDGS